MTQHQQIEGYKSQAKRALENLLTDSPSDLLTIVTQLDGKAWEALNAMPETSPEGVKLEYFGYWDEMEDRQEAEAYRVQNRLYEVRRDVIDYYSAGCPIIETWDTPGRIDLLTMLQILAHDRATRPEAYKAKEQ